MSSTSWIPFLETLLVLLQLIAISCYLFIASFPYQIAELKWQICHLKWCNQSCRAVNTTVALLTKVVNLKWMQKVQGPWVWNKLSKEWTLKSKEKSPKFLWQPDNVSSLEKVTAVERFQTSNERTIQFHELTFKLQKKVLFRNLFCSILCPWIQIGPLHPFSCHAEPWSGVLSLEMAFLTKLQNSRLLFVLRLRSKFSPRQEYRWVPFNPNMDNPNSWFQVLRKSHADLSCVILHA